MWLGAEERYRDLHETSIAGDHEAREKLGPVGSDRAGRDGSTAEAHSRRR